MKVLSRIAALALLAIGMSAFAHGNMDHIIGIVTKITGNVVTVDMNGKPTDVLLTPTTTYEASGKAGIQSDLKVGDRVVIHALKVEGKETAHEVRLVHPTK